MSREREPDEPHSGADAVQKNAADTIVYRALLRTKTLGVVTTLVLSIAILGIYATMFVMGVFAVGDLTGGTYVLAVAFLTVCAFAMYTSANQTLRALRTPIGEPGSATLPSCWRDAVNERDSRNAWRTRAVTAPLAVLIGVRFAHTGMAAGAAVAIASAAWLAPDVIHAVNIPARVRLHHVMKALYPGNGDSWKRRSPDR